MIDKHCTEHQLDIFLKMPEKLTAEEQKQIRTHISHCKLCEESLETLQKFYADLEKRLQKPATEKDRAFADTLLYRKATRLLPFRSVVKKQFEPFLEKIKLEIEPYRRPLPQRIFRYILIHPARVTGATMIAALILTAAFLIVRPSKDANPNHARIKDDILSVYNKNGDVLWTKKTLGMPDVISESLLSGEKRRIMRVGDIDGDESNEVLLTGTSTASSLAQDTLYCFNGDGKLRWQHGMGQAITFGKMTFTAYSNWIISNFFIIENRSTRKPRLFVLANADPYFSSKLFEVESKDGHELQSYWHAGYLNVILIHDIDLDGNKEIILGGINNAYRRACIAVIEPSHAHGHGPTTPEFTPENLSKGREKYYLLFPLTTLGEILGKSPYNNVNSLMLNKDGSFIVNIEELTGESLDKRGVILYTIIPKMKVITAIGSDTFIKLHEQLVKEGKLEEKLSTVYWEELKNSVLYWDGERFVKQPTGNALYFNAKNLP